MTRIRQEWCWTSFESVQTESNSVRRQEESRTAKAPPWNHLHSQTTVDGYVARSSVVLYHGPIATTNHQAECTTNTKLDEGSIQIKHSALLSFPI